MQETRIIQEKVKKNKNIIYTSFSIACNKASVKRACAFGSLFL